MGDEPLDVPAQVAIPVPDDLPVGTPIYVYQLGTIPDRNGGEFQAWFQVEIGRVDEDGFARTTSLPYLGVILTGILIFVIPPLDGALCDFARMEYNLSINSENDFIGYFSSGFAVAFAVTDAQEQGAVDYCLGNHTVEIVEIPPVGDPIFHSFEVEIQADTVNQFRATIPGGTPADSTPPIIKSTELKTEEENGSKVLKLEITGENFTPQSESAQQSLDQKVFVNFSQGGEDLGSHTNIFTHHGNQADNTFPDIEEANRYPGAKDISVEATVEKDGDKETIKVSIPKTVALGISDIRVERRQEAQSESLQEKLLPSNTVAFTREQESPYAFVAKPLASKIDVINTEDQTLAATISLGDKKPQFLAATGDGSRVYVTLGGGEIAVIDAIALQQIDAQVVDAEDTEINNISLTRGPLLVPPDPYQIVIVIDPTDRYAYISDRSLGTIDVLLIVANLQKLGQY